MNYNNIFNVDFKKLNVLLTPIFWRKRTFIDFLDALSEPISVLHSDFLNFRNKSIYKIKHNGQVMLLEKVLNDKFDNELRRIYISDAEIKEPPYIYRTIEQKPVYLGSRYVYDFNTFNESEIDFLVFFPIEMKPVTESGLNNLENIIKAIINFYKLASKRYQIIWI